MTMLDLETNAAYTRQRVAEIRALSRDDCHTPVIGSGGNASRLLRMKLGAALIAVGGRLTRVPLPQRTAVPETGLSS